MSAPTMSSSSGAPTPSRRVIVSLHFLPSSDTTLKPSIISALSSHLPLTDLQWRSSSRSTTRTIDSLNLEFRDFKDVLAGTEGSSPSSSSASSATTILASGSSALLEKPYLHILFVGSDDNEQYRITLRPLIREWMDSLLTLSSKKRSALEWLIVHVTAQKSASSSSSGPAAKFLMRKGSVYDKVRADFNTGKKDRCIQIPLPSVHPPTASTEDIQSSTKAWQDFLTRIKTNIIDSFDANFSAYEEDVRKVDQQRQIPGWNFCTFFVMKEGLAHSFEAMNLLEDSLIQYDELDASYSLSSPSSSLPWFSSLGGTSPGDDSLSILSSSSKPFRELIAKNGISIFDFRTYLFSRQAGLVINMGRVNELAKRGKPFIYSVARLMRAHGGALQRNFLEIWIYTSSLEIVYKCRSLLKSKHNDINPAAIPDLLPTLAELLELACRQVEKLGMEYGYLPRVHPFLMSGDSVQSLSTDVEDAGAEAEGKKGFESSNKELEDAMRDEKGFDRLYRGLLDQTFEAWNGSLRNRSANKVRATIAALEQSRGNPSASEAIYSTLSSSFGSSRWIGIEGQILRQTSSLQGQLQRPRDRLLSTLALIRSGMEVGSLTWTMGDHSSSPLREAEAEVKIAQDLLRQIKELSGGLEKDVAVVQFPTFRNDLEGEKGGFAGDEDGVAVKAVVTSYLPCELAVDEIRLKLVNTAGEIIWLTSEGTTLKPGRNIIQTTSLMSVTGTFALDLSQIRLSRIVFQYSHRPSSAGASASRSLQISKELLVQNKQPIVTFGHDPLGIDISVEEPLEVYLDKPRQITLCIHPGRGDLAQASLRLHPPQGRLGFSYATATVANDACKLESKEGILELSQIKAKETIKINLDYEVFTAQDPAVTVSATLDYYTTSRPSQKRTLRTSITFSISLPLAVNVQDFLRDECIISRFTVSTDSALPLRVRKGVLSESREYKVLPASRERKRPCTVRREKPAAFLFRISKKSGELTSQLSEQQEPVPPLRVEFSYRTLEDEARQLLHSHLSSIFSSSNLLLSRKVSKAIISTVLSSSTLDRIDRDRIDDFYLGDFDEFFWKKRLSGYWSDTEEWDNMSQCLKSAFETPVKIDGIDVLPWPKLSIPFEVPSVAIYNRVLLSFPEAPKPPLRIGDFLSVTLKIKTSFDWASSADLAQLQSSGSSQDEKGRTQRMLYDVHTKSEDWLVAGKKKGEFRISLPTSYTSEPEGGNELEVQLTLSPRRVGKLFLPSVTVLPLPESTAAAGTGPGGAGLQSSTNINPMMNLPSCETNNETAAMSFEVIEKDKGNVQFWIDRASGEVGMMA